jgi:ATP-dependent helicase/nuclease subunit A
MNRSISFKTQPKKVTHMSADLHQQNTYQTDLNADLNQMDAFNRTHALEHASFIVEAPAGAGKTELLTQRYLKLLATVQEPEEIIALTFTNKAAAEMRNRILLSLENAERQTSETAPHKLVTRQLAEAALKQARHQQWNILEQPSRLRIMTMDALCSSLTRQMPLLSKFGGQPAVSKDTEAHYLEAARLTIAHIAHETDEHDTVTTALRYLDNNSEKLIALLARMLAMRDQWLPLAGQFQGADIEQLSKNTETALKYLIAEALKDVLAIVNPTTQDALMPLARFAASNLSDQEAHDFAPLLDWQTPLKDDADDLLLWQALAKFLITNEKTYRKQLTVKVGFPLTPEGKQKKDDYFAIVNQLENSEIVGRVFSLPAIASLLDSQPIIRALTKLLMLAATHLWAVFQSSGEVDFVAIAQSAQLALENEQGATDLALKLDYKISHLLIDEFQDTSPVQMRLIAKLIEGWQPDDGRTLFCVGDPMQSIYRFRKADVSLFLQAANFGIGHLPLTRLQLSRNNRSHPTVVEWINQAFQQVFPANDDMHHGAISYRPFMATRAPAEQESVVVHPLIIDSGDDEESHNSKHIEACYVAKLIAEIRQKDAHQKIAVLVRSRSHLRELVTEIRRNHPQLAFQAVEIEHLNDRQTVQDALSLTRALYHRADRVHWLNILRAPWCGLTLADLHKLAGDDHASTIWQLMQEPERLASMSADGRTRLEHVKQILQEALDAQGRLPVRRWLESTWLRLGGGKCLIEPGDNRDVQIFFDLVERLSFNGHLDFTALENGMQKLYARPDITAPDNLQFLTIHKSKGLEFDTVILPALNRQPRHADHELVLWQEVIVNQQPHLIAAPLTSRKDISGKKSSAFTTYDFLKALETQRNDNEIVRLLYVAATRSERQLHLIATVKVNQKGELKPTAKSMLEVLWPAVQMDFAVAKPLPASALQNATTDIASFQPKLQRLRIHEIATVNYGQDSKRTAAVLNLNTASDAQLFTAADYLGPAALSRHSGILAHLYMELMAEDLTVWTAEKLQQCLPAMQAWLRQQGHAETVAAQAAIAVLQALQTTLASKAGQWVMGEHEAAGSELSMMQTTAIEDDLQVKNHVIDRTFIENGERWIIDYKLTDLGEQPDFNAAAELHVKQLERYAGLFKHEALPIRKAVLFLSLGELVEL